MRRGHDVTLFATADSLTYSRLTRTPVVTTIHGFSSERIVPVYAAYDDVAHYVAISDADRHPALHYDATIHHGIDLDAFTVGDGAGGYLLYLGRIHPDKGAHTAIEVARRAGMPLVMAGIVQDEAYFRELVEPQIDGQRVRFLGPVGPAERDRLLGGAAALLHPIAFAEPFGLSVVEALATGTPVIAAPLGTLPALVRHGVTGFLVDGMDEAVTAVGRIPTLDRAACRREAEARFSDDRMVDDYEALLRRVTGTAGRAPASGR